MNTFSSLRTGESWISPSMMRNYLLQDPLMDFLKMKNRNNFSSAQRNEHNNNNFSSDQNNGCNNNNRNNFSSDQNNGHNNNFSFQSFIMAQGVKFEELIVKKLSEKHKIVSFPRVFTESEYLDISIKTKNAIFSGENIIYQGVLLDTEKKIRGIPDFIIKNSYLKTMFTNTIIPDDGYSIVDVKFSTLNLTANGVDIVNSDSSPAYKGQLYVYTNLLGRILKKEPRYAFILGKCWQYTSKGVKYANYSPFERLGRIDYDGFDSKYKFLSLKALSWIRDLLEDGHTWKIEPIPSRKELYPNMSNNMDSPYHEEKIRIATCLGEITSLWYCGVREREIAHEKGILSWRDPRLTAQSMGIKGSRENIINKMIQVNNSSDPRLVYPEVINNDDNYWRTRKIDNLELFIDFETINTSILDISEGKKSEYIFLIGIGWHTSTFYSTRKRKIENPVWNFKSFLMRDLSEESEKEVITSFLSFVHDLEKNHKKNAILHHWSNAELSHLKNAFVRHGINNQVFLDKLFDLKEVFTNEPIIIKGCFGFGLKEITKKLNEYSYTNIPWGNSDCADGMTAMILAKKAYDDKNNSSKTFESIINYNELDCKAVYQLLNFIRTRPDNIEPTNKKQKLILKINIPTAKEPEKHTHPSKDLENSSTEEQSSSTDDSSIVEYTSSTDDSSIAEYSSSTETSTDPVATEIVSSINTLATEEQKNQILQELEPVSIEDIITSECPVNTQIAALTIYYESKGYSIHSSTYINAQNAIKKLIGVKSTYEPDYIYFDKNCINLSLQERNELSRLRAEYVNSKITPKDILSSNLTEKNKSRAIELYDALAKIEVHDNNYIDLCRSLESFVSNPINEQEEVTRFDRIKALVTSDHNKNIMKMWHNSISGNESDEEKQKSIEKLEYALSLPFSKSYVPLENVPLLTFVKEYKARINSKLYGMEKVKTQLIQSLINGDTTTMALCGPPGVGKTAICKAHAFASNYPITFCNIGSVNDVVNIKGSNGVWLGGEIGMITKSLINMGVNNGIMVLDEIDKLILNDNHGRKIYNLLLEIIDPSQNDSYTDDFLSGIKMDLSKIKFICTMNDSSHMDTILLDRIKVIHIDKYTIDDKKHIVREHFLPSITNNKNDIIITDEAIISAIRGTGNMNSSKHPEPGVRLLKQIINDCISWIKLVDKIYTEPEEFYSIVGESYKTYPLPKKENEKWIITEQLVEKIILSLGHKKEKLPDFYT